MTEKYYIVSQILQSVTSITECDKYYKLPRDTLSSFPTYNNNVPQHLLKVEFDAMKNLSQLKHIAIQKFHKGSSVVIVDRDKNIKKMVNFLNGQSKSQKKAAKDDDFLNFIISQEKLIDL